MTWGWHFIGEDMRLDYNDGALVVPGETLVVEGQLELCTWGLHASANPLDAFSFAYEKPIACRVRLGGDIIHGTDKMVASERTCVWMLTKGQADRVLHEFACWCAESVIHLVADEHRAVCQRAIDAKRGWLCGDVSDSDLDAARDAAWGAARDTAWAAAWGAARGASWDAARDAAWGAARGASWDAAWDDQDRQFAKMLKAAHRRQS